MPIWKKRWSLTALGAAFLLLMVYLMWFRGPNYKDLMAQGRKLQINDQREAALNRFKEARNLHYTEEVQENILQLEKELDSIQQLELAQMSYQDSIRAADSLARIRHLADSLEMVQASTKKEGAQSKAFSGTVQTENMNARQLQAYQVIDLDIIGSKIVGGQLLFIIKNYNPQMQYSLSLGNGEIRTIQKYFRYPYNLPGNYIIWLTATKRGQVVLRKKYGLIISENKDQPQQNPVEIVDSTTVHSENQTSTSENPTQSKPMKAVDIRPSFPGGDAAMLDYLNDKINYPQAARDLGVEGRVYVKFVVEPSGDLTNIEVVKGLGYGCDKEALRIVKSMPRWIPGQHEDVIVPVIYTIPVIYQLDL